jgi:hypothetical protein
MLFIQFTIFSQKVIDKVLKPFCIRLLKMINILNLEDIMKIVKDRNKIR